MVEENWQSGLHLSNDIILQGFDLMIFGLHCILSSFK
jgi:hypothetical protein